MPGKPPLPTMVKLVYWISACGVLLCVGVAVLLPVFAVAKAMAWVKSVAVFIESPSSKKNNYF
jgi:hypothetical protein